MHEGEQKIKDILKAIEIEQESQAFQHYVRNYTTGILLSLPFLKDPETSEQEKLQIQELCKRRVFFLLLLQRKIKNEGGSQDLDTFFTQNYQEKKIAAEVLEYYFLRNTATQ